MFLLSFALAATYEDDLSTDQGRWSGGVISGGVLTVTDTAQLELGALTGFSGSLRLRLVEGASLALQAGTATWQASYTDGGGLSLGEHALPFPLDHIQLQIDAQPVLGPDGMTWDGANTLHPEIIEHDGTYFLYWTGEMTPGYAYRQIGVATSTDGVTWTEYAGNPILTIDYSGDIDGVHVHMPTVVIDGAGAWHMYYACYQNNVGNRICHATSADGYTWAPQGMALDKGGTGAFDEGSLRSPDVWIDDGGTWHMLYNGTDPEEHYGPTGYATSPDGWTWTKLGAVSADKYFLQGGGVLDTPWGLYQWYNCQDVFCVATADPADPSDWTYVGNALGKASSTWDAGYIQAPSPWLIGTTYHMWFNAYGYLGDASVWNERIAHARSVPTPGAWIDLDVAWDGATLTVTQQGVALSTALTAADALMITVSGTAELDSISLDYTEAVIDTGTPDTGTPDSDPPDSATPDNDTPDSDPPADSATKADPAGCGCTTGGAPGVGALGLLLVLGRRRKR